MTCRVGHILPVVNKMDKIKMVVLTDVLRLVSWLIREIGLGFPNGNPCGLCGRVLCPSFSKVELFMLLA